MSRYRRADVPGATYFFTVVTYRRRPILCDDPVRAALRQAVKTVQSRHPFTVDAWVLLPDHLHCMWTLPSDDADYPLRWGLIKRMVSLACASHYHRADWMTASKTKYRESTIWQSFRVLLTPTFSLEGEGAKAELMFFHLIAAYLKYP
ncbi:hypothetical protein MGMO_15c00440 [Methyloglobulus morosus KoM1]|uniref:Transposase IS200-like domain-containing protein n=1 Tax=Methyloglobulus morosus KoM1 TaxID=1116472 RepID=V5C9Z8_9GAMM|nr:transposase [Methyloglobulus morosus]ESS73623.1 hypothetical protein MGMO_15c00440 [Methyloglobulus morosus KoM1]